VLFTLKTLRGVSEEELVGFFEGIGAFGQCPRRIFRCAHTWPADLPAPVPTFQRDGS
jgi:hypothetical protein